MRLGLGLHLGGASESDERPIEQPSRAADGSIVASAPLRDVLAGRFRVRLDGRAVSDGWIHPTAEIDPGARLDGPFYLGPRCRVEAGAVVGPDTVLTADVRVAERAELRDSVLWAGCSIGPESHVEGALLGPGVRTGCHVRIARGAVVGEGGFLPDYSRSA